ncbi:MAG: hypothetical protein KDI55_26510 [Anaerolineae bacterium]|nr:hypothetical protein [Anaerolineae bacterium]
MTNRILITADHCINDDFGSKGIGSTGGKYSLDYDNDGFADWTANLTHFSRSGVAFGKSRLNSEESASDIAFLALDRELPYWAQIYTMGAYKAEQNIPGLGFRSTTTVDVVGYGQQGVANSNAKNNWEVGGVGLDRWVGFNNVTNDEVDFGGASVLNITLDDLTPLTICSPGGECTTYFESIGAFGDSGSGLFQKQWHFETNSSGMLTPIEEYVMIGVLSTGSAEDVDPGAGKVQYTEYGDYSTYAGLGKHWISDALWDFEEVLGFDYWQDIVYLASLVCTDTVFT